ncbi:hypothetical protein D3C75_1085520 [compost metagenome]
MAEYAGSEGERRTVIGEVAPDQQQIDLAHELVFQAQGKAFFGHLVERCEGHVAGGADQRIKLAGLLEQFANRGAVTDVHLKIAAVAANPDDFVALRQFLVDCRADGAVCADQKNFHGADPRMG